MAALINEQEQESGAPNLPSLVRCYTIKSHKLWRHAAVSTLSIRLTPSLSACPTFRSTTQGSYCNYVRSCFEAVCSRGAGAGACDEVAEGADVPSGFGIGGTNFCGRGVALKGDAKTPCRKLGAG